MSVGETFTNFIGSFFNEPSEESQTSAAGVDQQARDELLGIIGDKADPYHDGQPATYLEYLHELQKAAAERQMEFQQASAREAMQFEADQAALNREFQREMSNTAYQRAVSDLRKAGLNPVLAVGASASTPAGSSAQGYAQSGAKPSYSEQNVAQETLKMYINSAVDIVDIVGKIVGGKTK